MHFALKHTSKQTPFHTKIIQTHLNKMRGRTLPILISTEHDTMFQIDYLRKMVICKHLQNPAFPSGAWEGSTDTSPPYKDWLASQSLCKQSWHYSESSMLLCMCRFSNLAL